MLSTFARAFKTPDLRRKLLFTLAMMIIFRIGSYIPTPGVNVAAVKQLANQAPNNDLFSLINLFSGGGLLQLSIFALGIMPYITASIIIQLLRVVIPRFDALYKEGQSGQTKLTQYTRYLTIGLAILQSTTVIATARSGALFGNANGPNVIQNNSVWTMVQMVIVMTAGTGFVMWLAELVTERGVGNGMSLLIFTSIIANFPTTMWSIGGGNNGVRNFAAVLIVFVAVIVLLVFVEQAQRRIPVQYAKRMIGRREYGGSSTYIPIRINMSGVIPPIFASSLLALPTMLSQFGNQNKPSAWRTWVGVHLSQQTWLYLVLYALLIIFFAFFYTSITFNPEETSDNMKKYGGFIPGIRAGRPTTEYLAYVINRITAPGSLYLAVAALIPSILFIILKISGSQLPFGGTTLLIIVGVGLDTVKQIESQLQQRHYEGFLR